MNRTGLRGVRKFQDLLTGNTRANHEALRDFYLNPYGLKVIMIH